MSSVLRQSRAALFCFVLPCFVAVGQAYGQFSTIFNAPPDEVPSTIASDTQLNLFDGGDIESHFSAGASDGTSTNVEVNIAGGYGGSSFLANSGSVVNIFGGSVGEESAAHGGSVVNIFGGSVGEDFEATSGSVVNISGGVVGSDFDAKSGSTVNISGGVVGDDFAAFDGSTVNISGGSVDGGLAAAGGSTVNLIGTQFVLDRLDVTASLTRHVPFPIDDRNVTLAGLLADDSAFSFELNSVGNFHDFFDPDAALTVTLVLPGDTNDDGLVNIDDLNDVRNHFGATGPDDGTLIGDSFPFDGLVDIDDLNAVRNNFGAVSLGNAVPEPASVVLALLCAGGTTLFRRQRGLRGASSLGSAGK